MSAMPSQRGSAAVLFIVRSVVGGLFVAAASSKLNAPLDAFSRAILSYELVTPMWAGLAAIFLPWVELAAGLCVLLGWWGRGGAIVLSAFMVLFTFVKASAVVRGLSIPDCGCFGPLLARLDPSGWPGVAVNIVWLGLCGVLVVADGGPWSLERFVGHRVR